MKRIILLFTVSVLLAAPSAWAFDGQREGFVIGFGIGGSYSAYKHERIKDYTGTSHMQEEEPGVFVERDDATLKSIDGDFPYDDSTAGVSTDFTIGYGITNQIVIAYDNRVSYIPSEIYDYNFGLHDWGETAIIIAGITNISASYYFQETGPSFYLIGGAGVFVWWPFANDTESRFSFGCFAGAGYEFSKHWSIELTLMPGFPENEFYKSKVVSIQLGIKGLAY